MANKNETQKGRNSEEVRGNAPITTTQKERERQKEKAQQVGGRSRISIGSCCPCPMDWWHGLPELQEFGKMLTVFWLVVHTLTTTTTVTTGCA